MRTCSACGREGHNRRTCTQHSEATEPRPETAPTSTTGTVFEKKADELLRVLDRYMQLKVTNPSQYENYRRDVSTFLSKFASEVRG